MSDTSSEGCVVGATVKTFVAGIAGMALAGAVLVAPGMALVPVSGRAASWGLNMYGQLGNNSTTDSSRPMVVAGLAGKTLTVLSAGYNHTCAVADGRAFCWGWNSNGQLGNNSTTNSSVPVAVKADAGPLAGKTVTGINTGTYHSCAVADGQAFCWGDNAYDQLGDDSTADSTVPVAVHTAAVLAGKTVTAISVGHEHSCAVADGRAYCWGWNSHGQVGDGSIADSRVPVAVSGLAATTVTAISTGGDRSCAVADGRAYCWGDNTYGQLGNGGTTDSTVPVAVSGLAGKTVTAISTGGYHSCAVADGQAYCWGFNSAGQLGDNSTTQSLVSVAVAGPAGATVTAISTGVAHSCAVADGQAFCWGNNYSGELGNNSNVDSNVPVAVHTAELLVGKTVTAVDAGSYHTAALAAAVPQPPTGVAGLAGDGKVTVSWIAPADDGGSPIQTYTATAAPGGATCTTGGTSCVVSGLTNGTGYTVTVTATNAIGTSEPSEPSAPVTPIGSAALAKVKGVKAKFHKGTVKITWKSVPNASKYRVRISKPGGTRYKAWKAITKRVFKAKVHKGKKYRFQVAAVGAAGRGPVTTIRFKGK